MGEGEGRMKSAQRGSYVQITQGSGSHVRSSVLILSVMESCQKALYRETHNVCLQNAALTNVCRVERGRRRNREMSPKFREIGRGLVLDHSHGEGEIRMDSGYVLKVESTGFADGLEVRREERIKNGA